jgi:hypothetical protein
MTEWLRLSELDRLLASVDVFEPLTPGAAGARQGRLAGAPGDWGGDDGEPSEHARRVILLLAGRAAVYEPGPRGRGLAPSVAEAGTVVGVAGLSERARGLRVGATMPSLLCLVALGAFEDVVRRNPEVGLRLVRVLGERTGVLEDRGPRGEARRAGPRGGAHPPGGRHRAAGGGRRGDGPPGREAPHPLHPPAAGEHGRGQPRGRHQGAG